MQKNEIVVHFSSYLKAQIFLREFEAEFPATCNQIRVLEVGSKSYHEHDTYRSLCPDDRYLYTGLDIEAGPNVDVVPQNPFVWREIADCSFDICLSGQTFEHNPYFWVTFAEVARVLRPGGLALIVAPGSGHVHRYPVDCWRFYPDAWAALAAMSGLDLVESYYETDDLALRVEGGSWRDSVCIARKPDLKGIELDRFHVRLTKIVALFAEEQMPVARAPAPGKFTRAYRREMEVLAPERLRTLLRRKWLGRIERLYHDPRDEVDT